MNQSKGVQNSEAGDLELIHDIILYIYGLHQYSKQKQSLLAEVPAKVKLSIGGSLSDSRFENDMPFLPKPVFPERFVVCGVSDQVRGIQETMLQSLMNQQHPQKELL